jgi:hypothetical protein
LRLTVFKSYKTTIFLLLPPDHYFRRLMLPPSSLHECSLQPSTISASACKDVNTVSQPLVFWFLISQFQYQYQIYSWNKTISHISIIYIYAQTPSTLTETLVSSTNTISTIMLLFPFQLLLYIFHIPNNDYTNKIIQNSIKTFLLGWFNTPKIHSITNYFKYNTLCSYLHSLNSDFKDVPTCYWICSNTILRIVNC